MINRPDGVDTGAATATQYTREACVQPVKLCLYGRCILPRVAEPVHDVGLIARDGIRRGFPFFYFCPKLVYSHTTPPDKKPTASGITRSLARREE